MLRFQSLQIPHFGWPQHQVQPPAHPTQPGLHKDHTVCACGFTGIGHVYGYVAGSPGLTVLGLIISDETTNSAGDG